MMSTHQPRRLLIFLCLAFLGCGYYVPSRDPDSAPSVSRSAGPTQEGRAERKIGPKISTEDVIWVGESSGRRIRWTTWDLYAESPGGMERIWVPLVEKGFEDFSVVYTAAKTKKRKFTIEDCTYERYFTVLSVVGSLVSFNDEYSDYCGGAHPSADSRFTTIDLLRPGQILYAREQSTPMMNIDLMNPGRVANLTQYFSERDILRALLADHVIQSALASLDNPEPPHSLMELSKLFSKQGYALGGSGFELRPDFLTRFAFHHIEGDRVAIRLSLPPATTANQSEQGQLGLVLPIPEQLRKPLRLAAMRQAGFLMKDAERIAGGKFTAFCFPAK